MSSGSQIVRIASNVPLSRYFQFSSICIRGFTFNSIELIYRYICLRQHGLVSLARQLMNNLRLAKDPSQIRNWVKNHTRGFAKLSAQWFFESVSVYKSIMCFLMEYKNNPFAKSLSTSVPS